MDDEDPWGDEPEWARDNFQEGGSKDEDDDDVAFGAQHVLVLIDCNRNMFVPCVTVGSDDGGGDESQRSADGSPPSISEGDRTSLVSPFEAALRASEKLLRLKVNSVATSRSGRRDGVGVMLYGTNRRHRPDEQNQQHQAQQQQGPVKFDSGHDSESDSDDDDDSPSGGGRQALSSTYGLIPIAPPGTKQVLQMRDCIPDDDGDGGDGRGGGTKRNLEEEFADVRNENDVASDAARIMGNHSLCSLRSALHEASKAFLNAKCVKKQAATSKNPGDSKTLWVFTNQDDPCGGNEEEKKQVIIVAKDAVENGLDINVWPLPRADADRPFDREKFFNFITTKDVHTDPSYMESRGDSARDDLDLNDILEDIDRQWKKIRKAQSVPLLLPGWEDRPDDPGIILDLFRPVQVKKKPVPVTVHQETNKMTEKKTETLTTDSEIITKDELKDRIRYYAEFGGTRVPISKEDVLLIRQKCNTNEKFASLVLNGFKPIGTEPTHNFQNTYFSYPNDEQVKGSRSAFAGLHSSMLRKKVWAVGELLVRATASSRMVAILPQTEGHDEDGRQVTPPGFILYQLPFEDDVRAVEADSGDVADETTVNAATELIKHQQLEGVEWGTSFENPALAEFWNYLESIAIGIPLQKVDNEINVEVDAVLNSAGTQIEALKLCLPEDEEKKGKKRKVATKADDSGVDWEQLYRTDGLADCNVEQLKKYLRSIGGKVGGKKADLIERVKDDISDRIRDGKLQPSTASNSASFKDESEDV